MQEGSESATNQSSERKLVSGWWGSDAAHWVLVLHSVIDMV